MTDAGISERGFLGTSALLFVGSAAATILGCASMSAMAGMPMPGGWTMSMTWMRMPDQSWTGAAFLFLGMWTVMMAAMMLPSLVPMLRRYRRAVRARGSRLGGLTGIVAAAYFTTWIAFGVAAFPIGVALSAIAMRQPELSRLVPFAASAVVLCAGGLQLTHWKARRLECCREARGGTLAPDAASAWRHGLLLGLECLRCCLPWMAVLLVLGVMDLRAMAVVTAAISLERLAPAGRQFARATGAVVVGAGLILIAKAFGLG